MAGEHQFDHHTNSLQNYERSWSQRFERLDDVLEELKDMEDGGDGGDE